ncbi:hypothetical protein [Streptococcus pneumoniae]|nr:hypothetical protein [Streptococcus pneumoniae]
MKLTVFEVVDETDEVSSKHIVDETDEVSNLSTARTLMTWFAEIFEEY